MITLKHISSIFLLASLAACSSGDGTISGDNSNGEIVATRGTTVKVTKTVHTSDNKITEMKWQAISPTPNDPSLTISNADCAVKIQQEASQVVNGQTVSLSDWTCSAYVAIPSNAPINNSYSLLLITTTASGSVQTTETPIRIN